MLLLLVLLFLRGGAPEEVGRTADALLGHFSLLFVPAGVGVMVHWERIQDQWVAIVVALLLGTLLTMAVTALVMSAAQRLLSGWSGRKRDEQEGER